MIVFAIVMLALACLGSAVLAGVFMSDDIHSVGLTALSFSAAFLFAAVGVAVTM